MLSFFTHLICTFLETLLIENEAYEANSQVEKQQQRRQKKNLAWLGCVSSDER